MLALIRRALRPVQPRGSVEVQPRAGATVLWEFQPLGTLELAAGHSFFFLGSQAVGFELLNSLWILVSFFHVWGIGGLVDHEAGTPGSKDEITASHMYVLSSLPSLSLLLSGQG